MSIEILTLIMLAAMMGLMVIGLPLVFVTGVVSLAFALALYGPMSLTLISSRVYSFVSVYALVAVPMFVLMASILERSGVAKDLFKAMHIFAGGLKGGLAIQTMAVAVLMAAMTGIIGGEIVLLVLGQDYSKYSYIFEWLLLVNLLIFMSKKMMYLINIRHYQDIFTKVYFAMTLMVITLSYLLIKDYGINGFIVMNLLTGFLLIYLLKFFYKRRLL